MVFILGIALGGVGAHLWDAHMRFNREHHSVVRELKRQLHLSPEQTKQFDAIISDDRTKFHGLDVQLHAEWDPKYDQVRHDGRQSIRAILTADQRAKFNSFIKKLDERRQKQEGH